MPMPNNHACLIDDSLTVVGSMTRDHKGKEYTVRIGRKAGSKGSSERSYIYPKDKWTADEARAHCKSRGGRFEPASSQTQETMSPDNLNPAENPFIKMEEDT